MRVKAIFISGLTVAAALLQAQNLDIVAAKQQTWKVGEDIPFTVSARVKNGELYKDGTFTLSFLNCGDRKISDDLTIDLSKGNPAKFSVKLDHPGFILVKASKYRGRDGKEAAWKNTPFAPLGGAGVEPEKIRPGLECPADFDSFWQAGLKEFKNAAIEVTPAPDVRRKNFKVSRITVKFPDGSGIVSGYLSFPEKPGKYPALAGVPGAACVSGYPFGPKPHWSSPVPAIELHLNVHNFLVPVGAKEQKVAFKRYIKSLGCAYHFSNASQREKYFFRNVWLAVSRAIDFVAALPEYDGRHFAAAGNSQGGGTALVLGGLNKNITCVVASVPALCDHGGWKLGRQAGRPQFHNRLNGKADEAMRYFDAAFFAARIRVPTLVSVGFVDVTCSPSSVYAAYNLIPSKVSKRIFPMYRSGHSGCREFSKEVSQFLRTELTR